MNMKKLLISAISLSLTGGLASTTALAQDAQEASIFEEVIVTATKREQSIYDVPVAVSAFTAATIEKQGIVDLTDVGKFVPNLNVTGFSAGHTSSVNAFIRGIGLQDHLITTDPGVGVYVDGVKIASLGLRIRRGKSFHGLAFNINMDLEPFQRINPCGFEGLQVTNLSAFTEVSMTGAEDRLIVSLSRNLGYNGRFCQVTASLP